MKLFLLSLIILVSVPSIMVFADSEETAEFVELLNIKGLEYMLSYDFDKAESHFDQVLEIDPNHVEALNNKGSIVGYYGNSEEALSYFKRALELDPNNAMALNNMGSAFAKIGEMKEAASYFKKALEIDPNYEKARMNLGTTLTKPIHNIADGFTELIVRDSQGNLVVYLKTLRLKILNHPLVETLFMDDWNTGETITREGKEFQVYTQEFVETQEKVDPFKTVGRWGGQVRQEGVNLWVYASPISQVPLHVGDEITTIITFFKPVE